VKKVLERFARKFYCHTNAPSIEGCFWWFWP